MPYYLHPIHSGLALVSSQGDGSTITLKWNRAFPQTIGHSIAYNIYMDVVRPDFEPTFFLKNPVFVSVDGKLTADIVDLIPGQMYRFGVRAVEFDKAAFDFATLPVVAGGLHIYPDSVLRSNITAAATIIPLLSTAGFPAMGVVKIGVELVQYSSISGNDLVLTSAILQRGFNDTTPRMHNTDGYDGDETWDPAVILFPVDSEEQNTVVYSTQDRFDYPHYSFNLVDGYRQTTKDIVNPDLSVSDAINEGFPAYDYAGYHRIDPVALFNGECVGSYFGGQLYCADGYDGVGRVLRGISVDDRNTQRQEVLLSLIGESVCLVKRQTTGIRCFCVLSTAEMPDARCTKCYGSGFVVGYTQYFDNRNSDGRIRIRIDPYVDTLPIMDSGLSVQDVKPNAWTLVLPAIKPRDFIVRFDANGNEEFRYEVISVGRGVLFDKNFGGQKLTLQRIRRTDIIYQCKVFRDTSTMPTNMATSISSSLGVAPHSHTFVKSEKHPMTWQQITSVSAGHSHIVQWNPTEGVLEVSEELSHQHLIIY